MYIRVYIYTHYTPQYIYIYIHSIYTYIYVHTYTLRMYSMFHTDTSRRVLLIYMVASQRLRHARDGRPSDGGKATQRCPGVTMHDTQMKKRSTPLFLGNH